MKEIRICDMDSDRVVLEAIMEGVNGLIRAKNEEAAPSASTNTRITQALREIAASMEQMAFEPCQNGAVPIYPATLQEWARQLRNA
jgi:hypothetical protein